MSNPSFISTKKAILWGGVIGLVYPIATFILGVLLNRIFPFGQGLLDGLVTPIKNILHIAFRLDATILHPMVNLVCAGGRMTPNFGCEIILALIETILISMLLGILIGWLATIVARYGKKRPTS